MAEDIVAGSTKLWMDYLSFHPTYRELRDLKKREWSDKGGDTFFENRRKNASKPNQKGKASFYEMTKQVDKGMALETNIFKLDSVCPRMLDLCMAPGGFTTTAAKDTPGSLIDAVTLPTESGGYEVMAKNICQNIIYADITMYLLEMACQEIIPTAHPDSGSFELCQPFLDNRYDIAICGGAVGRDHPRESYRSDCESQRLMVSQLVFAMHRLKPGGSLVLLLHRIESWDTVCILHAFNEFSDIQLYKHPKAHAIKSSFYLVAKRVNLEHHAARESMEYWKSLWKYLTFKNFEEIPLVRSNLYGSDETFVQYIRDSFGPQFLRLAEPIWEVQAEALRNAPFMRHAPRFHVRNY